MRLGVLPSHVGDSGGTPNGVGGRGKGVSLADETTPACEGFPPEVFFLGYYHKTIYFSIYEIYLSCPKVSSSVKENTHTLEDHS